MDVVRIKDLENELFKEFISVYSVSFPVFEQRTTKQHIYALGHSNYFVNCYINNGAFIGFIVYWEFDDYIYIEHLAIHPEQRGKSFGSLVLSKFIEQNSKTIILEIDPLEDEVAIARYGFYKNLGFVKNKHKHTHPAYREEFPNHKLIVLSTGKEITKKEYEQFHNDLRHIVMNRS